jgi:hypothetical protein
MIEELLFRGLVQGWLTRLISVKPPSLAELDSGQILALEAETHPPLPLREDRPENESPGEEPSEPPLVSTITPTRFPLVAIIATSFAFAALHAPQWPAPIAIFVLSLCLGTVYWKTGSLIAAMALHAAFNGVSTLMSFLEALARHQ